jgi:GNAT superfamily N-acetyltransferase
MSITLIKNIKPEKSQKFVDMIYANFIDLCNYNELNHNKQEITRLITSQNAKILLIIINKKIAAYLVGEIMDLNDGRKVFYISYIFTSKHFRKQGFGSKLLNFVEKQTKKFGYDGVLLTCDTEDANINNFYLIRGFMPDLVLRRYTKHDVLYKKI